MINHSFTDEQLLNFVNNTITSKTEFDIKDELGKANEHKINE